MKDHATRLFKNEEPQEDGEPLRYDEGLWRWWLNYYFAEHDPEMQWQEIPLYTIDPENNQTVVNCQTLERVTGGKADIPKIPFEATIKKIELEGRNGVHFFVEWRDMNWHKACRLMDLCEEHFITWRAGDVSDYSGKFRKQMRKLLPNCKIDSMDVKQNLYGDENRWFYLNFEWEPEHFSWAQVRKALKFVKEKIVPLVGEYRKKAYDWEG
jgi:hypothetical protein